MIKFSELKWKKENIYLLSDTHYSHLNICKSTTSWDKSHSENCRDFPSIEEMNKAIVDSINSVVKEDDLIIHCGDWSFGGVDKIFEFRKAINCKNIILIRGNHDHKINLNNFIVTFDRFNVRKDIMNTFTSVHDIGYFKSEDFSFMCCHYPMYVWHQSHKSVPLIFGHTHGQLETNNKSFDVGIDNLFKLFGNYSPIRLDKLEKILNEKPILLDNRPQNRN